MSSEIVQVLLLFEERNVKDYGLALWAALHEVERFFEPVAPKPAYTRRFVSPVSLEPGFLHHIGRGLAQIFLNAKNPNALDLLPASQRVPNKLAADEAVIVDQNRLVGAIRDMLPNIRAEPMLIVTDRAIIPPPSWRYVIWDEAGSPPATVLSVAPLDPLYWRENDANRILTIKARMRAAALSITGTMLGIGACSDRSCVMFSPVLSVLDLDDMQRLGGEHEQPALENRSFSPKPGDPTEVQPVVPY
jgi:hypothetical protein